MCPRPWRENGAPCWSRRVLGEPKGEADRFPLPTPRFDWLRGSDLNRRPLGYEYKTAMTGNPLILQERRSAASGSTLSDDVVLRLVPPCFGVLWEQNGSRNESPILSTAGGVGRRDLRPRPGSGSGRWMIASRLLLARVALETPNRGANFCTGSD
jgi:hypothetical protein